MKANDLNIDMKTRALLEKGGIEETSADFTQNVLSRVKALQKPLLSEYQPVISRKGWMIISAFMFILTIAFVSTGFLASGDQPSSYTFSNEIMNSVNNFSYYVKEIFSSIPEYMLLIPIALLFFLGFDKLLKSIINKRS